MSAVNVHAGWRKSCATQDPKISAVARVSSVDGGAKVSSVDGGARLPPSAAVSCKFQSERTLSSHINATPTRGS